ncbi:MAG: glycosyltransferase family 4 protein [Marinoscillum sp.]
MRVAIITNISWNLFNFRSSLAKEIKSAGHDVFLLAGEDAYSSKLEIEGYTFIALKSLERTGKNPIKDILLFQEFKKVFKQQNIEFAILYHAKPMVYGALAARMLGIPYLATITGLAGPFSGNRRMIGWLVTLMYRFSLAGAKKVFFQNDEDLAFFLNRRIVKKRDTDRVWGSGIDLDQFSCSAQRQGPSDEMTFLLFGRLSYLKGIDLYAQAAGTIRKSYPKVKFLLAGPYDSDENAISKEQIELWVDNGWIDYLGVSDFIQKEIKMADVIVYPSFYKEGAPRALIESSAMCKPIITTDNVGCRDVVKHEFNGLLIEPQNQQALEDAILKTISMPREELKLFGENGRKHVEQYFSSKEVNSHYLKILENK